MRYPTYRNGLAVNPVELDINVPSQLDIDRRKTTNHHNQWTRASYQSVRHRSVFRNLVTNVYPLLRDEHEQLHQEYAAPVMPTDFQMIEHVEDYLQENGVIECIREKKTNEVYEIQPDEWQLIKGLYRRAA